MLALSTISTPDNLLEQMLLMAPLAITKYLHIDAPCTQRDEAHLAVITKDVDTDHSLGESWVGGLHQIIVDVFGIPQRIQPLLKTIEITTPCHQPNRSCPEGLGSSLHTWRALQAFKLTKTSLISMPVHNNCFGKHDQVAYLEDKLKQGTQVLGCRRSDKNIAVAQANCASQCQA